jgi:hypothetical protein
VRVWIQCAKARVRILEETEYRDDEDKSSMSKSCGRKPKERDTETNEAVTH